STTPDKNVIGPDGQAGENVWFGGTPWGTPADRGLKGSYEDEFSIGVERLLDPTLTVGLKASYRRLGNAVEDRCDLDPNQNNDNGCAVINPGSNSPYARGDFYYCTQLDGEFDNCNSDSYQPLYGAAPTPPARRLYRGVELLARKSVGSTLWLQ